MVEEKTLFFFCLCFCHLVGVFGVELKSVKEGDSVTLQTNVTEIPTDDLITWMFGTNRALIARTDGGKSVIPDVLDGLFRDRLKLDEKTGSLTITNIRAEHAGVYEVEISSRSAFTLRFNVTVYAATTTPTPTPTLPSSSNHTSGPTSHPISDETVIILATAAGFLLIVAAIVIFFIYRKHRKTDQPAEAREEEITYADTTFFKNNAPSVKKEEDVVYAGIVTRK